MPPSARRARGSGWAASCSSPLLASSSRSRRATSCAPRFSTLCSGPRRSSSTRRRPALRRPRRPRRSPPRSSRSELSTVAPRASREGRPRSLERAGDAGLESPGMEAAAAPKRAPARELSGEKATRIVEAMRASVAERGIAGSTFDVVAREAGVSRGLLHYYFGTKERLLVEAVRRETEIRGALLRESVTSAQGADELIDGLVRSFEDLLGAGSSDVVMFYELLTLAQRNDGIAAELSELSRTLRLELAGALRTGRDAGVFELRAGPEEVASFLLVLAD